MEALEAIRSRRSVREYGAGKLPREVIEKVVDAGRLAATARNEQPWEFVAVTVPESVRRIAEITDHGRFMAGAAACVAVLCRETKYYLEDGAAATQNMLIAAAACGVGSCWIAGDKKPYCGRILEELGAPPGHRLVSLVALGYPLNEPAAPAKRTLKELLHWEKFQACE